MQLFGNVINISKDKSLIARCNSVLSLEKTVKLLYKPLFSDKQRKIGEVAEIFGPVSSPYITVKPKHGLKVQNFVGKSVYIGEENR